MFSTHLTPSQVCLSASHAHRCIPHIQCFSYLLILKIQSHPQAYLAKQPFQRRTQLRSLVSASSENGNGSAPPPNGPTFALRQIVGDGRCMYRALSQGAHYCALLDANKPPKFLSPSDETIEADSIRDKICDALLERKDHFSAFIDSDEGASFEDYVANMRKPWTFGGEPELAAAADVLKRPISIFQLNPELKQIALVSEYLCSEDVENPGDWPIPLVYHAAGPNSGHYDLLAPVEIEDDKPPPGLII